MRMTEVAGQLTNILQWRHVVITYVDQNGDVKVMHEVTRDKDKFIQDARKDKVVTILSVNELFSLRSSGNCPKCNKPFVLGDEVYKHNLTKHTIVFLDRHLAYFGERYEGEDGLDIHEQTRYIVHAHHVSQQQLDTFRQGQSLWTTGMGQCNAVETSLWS